MPTCLALTRAGRPPLTPAHARCLFGNRHALCKGNRRTASSAVAFKPAFTSSDVDVRHHVLTVLHKTRSLLPRILPPSSNGIRQTLSLDLWSALLEKAHRDLCLSTAAQQEDHVRIAVYGCDDLSGAQELVTALLDHPFSNDAQRAAIQNRWKDTRAGIESVSVQYGAPSLSEPGSLRVQSAWLQQFGVPLEVLELRAPATEGKAVKTLLSADVPIIVCNSATTPLPSLLTRLAPVLAHPNAVLVLTSSSGSEALINRIRSLCEHDLTILFIDPSRALKALRILSSAPSSSTAVEKYQENFTASNLSKLTEAVSHAIVDAARGTSSFAVVQNLHAQTAHSIVQNSLSACQSVLQTARHEVDELCTQVSALRARAEEVRVKAAREVFGPADGSKSDAIQTSLDKSRRDIKPTMDSLTWWKLLLRPDDVGDTVLTIVDQVWCKDLEHRLVFHAGRLASSQSAFTESSKALLASFPPRSPFHSPILQNSLLQLSSTPAFAMDAVAFTLPLSARRQQFRFPTARLQSAAQRAVLTMWGSVSGGMGIAWTGWAGQLGILDMSMQPETAWGIGMLGAIAGVRWAIGRFEGAKRKWWKDYNRVGEGLERNLKDTLEQVITERVLLIPEQATSGLDRFISKRKDEIEELREEVVGLDEHLNEITSP